MTHSDLFTAADVERGAAAWDALMGYRYGAESGEELAPELRCILAATLPAIRARWLRELAETPHIHPLTREWLLSVAEAEER